MFPAVKGPTGAIACLLLWFLLPMVIRIFLDEGFFLLGRFLGLSFLLLCCWGFAGASALAVLKDI